MTPLSSIRQNTVRTYYNISTAGPTHPVHSGTNTTRLTSHFGHPSHHRTRQHLQHHSIQKTHPYRSMLTLGQQPPHHSKTKCLQHLSTQGQNCFFIPGQNGQGARTYQNSPQTLPIPLLGPQPVATQVHPLQSAVQQHYQHIQQQQHNRQQQKQGHHCSTIHTKHK